MQANKVAKGKQFMDDEKVPERKRQASRFLSPGKVP